MWEYKQPGFALHLLCELQKQQQCSLHCDILLQTQGVSIPAHSCVLSALSPVFGRAFANVPSLPIGQSRLVQLEAVGAHALMKLVGFMYSGEMEGETLDEQQEVIEIAYRLGFSNFIDGKKKQVNRHQDKTASWKEIGLQTEETGGRKNDASIQILSEKQTFTHSGTQTNSPEAHFADMCVASERRLSVGPTGELTEIPSEFNSISPDAGLARIEEFVAHSQLNSAEAMHTKSPQNQKAKQRSKPFRKRDTQISLKIKLKRQRSGALWEVVSIQEESTAEGSKTCRSSDDPSMTHSLAERSGEVQLSLSAAELLEMDAVGLNILPSVTVEGNGSTHAHLDQNLEKCAALSNPSASYLCLFNHNLGTVEFGTSCTSEQRETGSEDYSNCRKWNPKNVSFAPPCSVTTDIMPSKFTFGTEGLEPQDIVELNNVLDTSFWGAETYSHQIVSDPNEGCTTKTRISRTTISNAALDEPTTSDKWCPETRHVTDQVSVWQSSIVAKVFDSDNSDDFSEMRLPRCLSPLAPEASKTTGIFTQDPFRPLEFSSCLSSSHSDLQPIIGYTSPPTEPQALPGKTNPQYPSCTSPHLDELKCSVVEKNSCPLKSNRGHNGEVTDSASEEKKTKTTGFEIDTKHGVETIVEPYRKKAKMADNLNGFDAQTVKVVHPCSVKIKNLRHIPNIQDISNPVTPENMDCLRATKINNTLSTDLKSQEKLSLCKKSQPIKCKDQEVCRKKVQDLTQPAMLVAKCRHQRLLQKRKCTTGPMKDLCTISKINNLFPVASSSCCHDDSQVTQMSVECAPNQGSGGAPRVHQLPLGLASTIRKVNSLISECEQNKVAEPEMENPLVEPEKIIPAVNLNREGEKQPKTYFFCDKIFHQTISSAGPTATEHFLPVNQQPISILQTNVKKTRSRLSPSKKLRKAPESVLMSTKLLDNFRQEKKDNTEERERHKDVSGPDKPGKALDTDKKVDSTNRVESEHNHSSINVDGCLENGNIAKATNMSANTGLSIPEAVDLNADFHFFTVPSARDVNNHFQLENNLQHKSTKALFLPFRSENVIKKPKTDEQITESNDPQEEPVSSKKTVVNLIQTKELHLEESRSVQIGKDLDKEKEKENTNHVDMNGMNEKEAGIRDIEVEVLEESAQIAAGHGDEMVNNGGDVDVEESENSLDLDDDEANEQEFNEQYEATVEMTSEVINTEAPSNQLREEPDLSSSSVNTFGSSAVILLVVNTKSAVVCSSDEEELVVDDLSDSPIRTSPVVGTRCNTILEEENVVKWIEQEKEEEDEEVDVTGEESN